MISISLDSAYTSRGLYRFWWVMSSKGTRLPACCAEATATMRAGALACSVSSSSWVSRKGAKALRANVISSPSALNWRLPNIPPAL